jgi:tyrosine-protein kinase Etk/Wzc
MIDTITGTHPVYSRRRQEARAAWLGSRARNALRHPWKIASIGTTVFVAALILLILAPRGPATRSAKLQVVWRDTASLLSRRDSLEHRRAQADSLLATRLRVAGQPQRPAFVDTAALITGTRRADLEAQLAEIGKLLARAEASPLAESYRAIGESPVMRKDPRVRQLLDTLTEVEREREEFDVGGGVDPIYVSLTTRLNAVGRAIQSLANSKRASIRDELNQLRPATPRSDTAPVPAPVDTVTPRIRRDAFAAAVDSLRSALASARRFNDDMDRQLRRARQQANVTAPPIAILTAALVLGLSVGFAASFLSELRTPRVADLQEVERSTGARVLAVIRPRDVPDERARRQADRQLARLLDPTSDAYRLLTSHVSVTDEPYPAVTVTGDVPAVNATIAANLAAVSVHDARSTLLVDIDLAGRATPRVLQMEASSGLSEILDGTVEWAGAIRQIPVGRDRTLDVLPPGRDRRARISESEAPAMAREIGRIARRYDLSILVAPFHLAAVASPTRHVLVCAHIAHTPLAVLNEGVHGLREHGSEVVGIVLWAADAPDLHAIAPRAPGTDETDIVDTASGPAFVVARRS